LPSLTLFLVFVLVLALSTSTMSASQPFMSMLPVNLRNLSRFCIHLDFSILNRYSIGIGHCSFFSDLKSGVIVMLMVIANGIFKPKDQHHL
jgi:hypothetical protein